MPSRQLLRLCLASKKRLAHMELEGCSWIASSYKMSLGLSSPSFMITRTEHSNWALRGHRAEAVVQPDGQAFMILLRASKLGKEWVILMMRMEDRK